MAGIMNQVIFLLENHPEYSDHQIYILTDVKEKTIHKKRVELYGEC